MQSQTSENICTLLLRDCLRHLFTYLLTYLLTYNHLLSFNVMAFTFERGYVVKPSQRDMATRCCTPWNSL